MNGRRRKDEPFNPFAPNASQKARDRKERNPRPQTRPKPPEKPKQVNDLASRQKEAMEALKQRGQITNKTPAKSDSQTAVKKHQISPQPKPVPKTSVKKPDDRKDRLANLRAKSAATVQFAKEAKDSAILEEKLEEIEPEIEPLEAEIKEPINIKIEDDIERRVNDNLKSSSNVFKTIKTQIKKTDRKSKKRRSNDKKGGGRQPQSRKLDRRKYLEYKYAARELLDNESVSEEHRSNILGQIWAKGERTGVEDAISFIAQKESENIIPSDVADEFRNMIRKYTTKR